MLNLFNYLSELDNKRIENYIQSYGVQSGYIGNTKYLQDWAENKKKLFHLLGGNLIVKQPYIYHRNKSEIESDIHLVIRNNQKFFDNIDDFFSTLYFDEHKLEKDTYYDILSVFEVNNFINQTIKLDKPIKVIYKDKKLLQIQNGTKVLKAIQKILKYFDIYEQYETVFENISIAYSLAFNEKEVIGQICISIHPLDFITMSDNSLGWSSCMSWVHQGCYHAGTVEMMNSNNVICAYIEGKEPYYFGRDGKPKTDEYKWKNKKWRQLFYITKDIIVGGKSYPYANEDFTKTILEMLRNLAKENLNWTYEFGPELYLDMKNINCKARIDNNREWIALGLAYKKNILFDTNAMYNDMLNDNHRQYFCIRNKVKKAKLISYSGKCRCLKCLSPVISERDDFDDECDGYNDRFDNVNNVICEECINDARCYECGNENGYWDTLDVPVDSVDKTEPITRVLCKSCINEFLRYCPVCHKNIINIVRRNYVYGDIKHCYFYQKESLDGFNADDFEYASKREPKLTYLYTCSKCEEVLKKNSHEVHLKPSGQYAWVRSRTFNVMNKDIPEEQLRKYYKENLEKVNIDSLLTN